ncbi:L-lactate dehydrogenase complex protein LldG [Bacillus ectoiniformans]|uniref:LutC/YkgG family protein n=1 Tax=Bacillus ectoiniformans TaxID=1494429 RepID=UPI00195ECC0B|nr:lactate utilization protein C [Bacillus ectoiniformans]MBM7648596.1 L-lactate dehydrogenase complex protein LldG [Bacillus ectoiniformans]
MTGTIHNRDSFLSNISKSLGREKKASVERPKWKFQPQHEVLKGASQDELMQVLKDQCRLIHTEYIETTREELANTLASTVNLYGGGPLSLWNDPRFEEYGLSELVHSTWPSENKEINIWDPAIGEKNIELAEKANIGITFTDMTLAESGTVVLLSSKDKGRSVSLLPQQYIAIIPKSTLVPRMTQAAQAISKKVQNGELIPSCINFITGPSNSADIEMNLVVGVHGPVKAAYIVISDC